jgi:hypothetical protein
MFPEILGLAALVLAALALAIAVFNLIVDWPKDRWRTRFREQLKAAVILQSMGYADLQHLAERWNQDRQAVLHSLRMLLSEAIAGEGNSLSERADFLRRLLLEHQAREPYAELPQNISLQLAALQNFSTDRPDAIPQLATSLSDLYSKNQRDLARQKKLTVWGFVVGVLGLLASLPGLYSLWRT